MSEEKKVGKRLSVGTVVCIVLCVLMLPLLLINVTLITKSLINPDKYPDVFGYMPMAVESGSMDNGKKGCIKKGDLIFVKEVDIDDLDLLDIVTFKDAAGDYTTHRIIEISTDRTQFVTKGDNALNNVEEHIPASSIEGKYTGTRIGGLGKLVLFLRTPWGVFLFVGIPVAAYVAFEVISRINAKNKKQTMAEKDAEIERLRALVEGNMRAEQGGPSELTGEVSVEEAPPKEE